MDCIKKISSEKLLQELINRKVLTQIPVGLYKEFELKRKYKKRNEPISYDGVFLLNMDPRVGIGISLKMNGEKYKEFKQ